MIAIPKMKVNIMQICAESRSMFLEIFETHTTIPMFIWKVNTRIYAQR